MSSPSASVRLDSSLFSAEAIKRAAYTIAAQAAVDIRKVGTDWVCELMFLKNVTAAEVDEAVASFRIEVLDQDLRQTIASETRDIRNAILAVAFSKTGLQSGG